MKIKENLPKAKVVSDKIDVKNLTDEAVISEILEHQKKEFFEIIYDRYTDRIYQKCISFTSDSSEAQDLAHDIFVKLYINLSKFKGQSQFSTWVYAITYNQCVDHHKEQKKSRNVSSNYSEAEFHDREEPADEDLFRIRADHLIEALELIDPDDKALLLMKYQDGYSLKTIMQVLDVSESAVKMRLKRSKHRLLVLIDERSQLKKSQL